MSSQRASTSDHQSSADLRLTMTSDSPDCDILSVKALSRLSNPFSGVCWSDLDVAITREEVSSALGRPLEPESGEVKSRDDHARRIAWFVINGFRDPILVDIGVPTYRGFRHVWDICDGNHRFAAAIYRGDEVIRADFTGSLDYANDLGLIVSLA